MIGTSTVPVYLKFESQFNIENSSTVLFLFAKQINASVQQPDYKEL